MWDNHYYRGRRFRRTPYNVSMDNSDPIQSLKQLEQETRSTRESLRKLDKLPPILPQLTREDEEMLEDMGIKW